MSRIYLGDRPVILERAAADPGERKVLYLDDGDERRERRYMEPRWPPSRRECLITDAVRLERQVVFWPCATADLVIDTSALPADLMRPLTGHFALDAVGRRIFVTSFARHHGIPGLPI